MFYLAKRFDIFFYIEDMFRNKLLHVTLQILRSIMLLMWQDYRKAGDVEIRSWGYVMLDKSLKIQQNPNNDEAEVCKATHLFSLDLY